MSNNCLFLYRSLLPVWNVSQCSTGEDSKCGRKVYFSFDMTVTGPYSDLSRSQLDFFSSGWPFFFKLSLAFHRCFPGDGSELTKHKSIRNISLQCSVWQEKSSEEKFLTSMIKIQVLCKVKYRLLRPKSSCSLSGIVKLHIHEEALPALVCCSLSAVCRERAVCGHALDV